MAADRSLTGLLTAIGAAIGVGALYLFVVLAVGMNLVGYWFSDKIELAASRAGSLEPGHVPWLRRIVEDLAHQAEVPVRRLYLIPSEQPNAFATGRNPQHAAVAVTEGLLEQFPADQVKGVLAHEFAHIKNHDILISSISAMVAGAISAIASILQFSMLFGGSDEDESPLGFVGTLAAIVVASRFAESRGWPRAPAVHLRRERHPEDERADKQAASALEQNDFASTARIHTTASSEAEYCTPRTARS